MSDLGDQALNQEADRLGPTDIPRLLDEVEFWKAEQWAAQERIRKLSASLASAWEQGYFDGVDDATMSQDFRAEFHRAPHKNPYREAK